MTKPNEMTEPREMTAKEVKEALLDMVWRSIDYFETTRYCQTDRERLIALAKSILYVLNFGSPHFPRFILAPDPINDAWKETSPRCGEPWWPENFDAQVNCRVIWEKNGWREGFERDFFSRDPQHKGWWPPVRYYD